MNSQVYFSDIQELIITEIRGAEKCIYVAVAWLTDKAILRELSQKAKSGVDVKLLMVHDDINIKSVKDELEILVENGGEVCLVGASTNGGIMHHKFCVLDEATVITGSYNWSRKARSNDENIVIAKNAVDLCRDFTSEFNSMRSRYFAQENANVLLDHETLIKRLDIIKGLIVLEEFSLLAPHVEKIRGAIVRLGKKDVLERIERGDLEQVLALIEEFKSAGNELVVFEDFNLFALKLELKSLELQLNAIENEIIELERRIHEFSIQYNNILGPIILEILGLKKLLARNNEEEAQAGKFEEDFKEEYTRKKEFILPELSDDDVKVLKKAYREASLKCHPDKFVGDPEKMRKAEAIFVELSQAYKSNDIARVEAILEGLNSGVLNDNFNSTNNKSETIRISIVETNNKISSAIILLEKLKESNTYKILENNLDSAIYLEEMKLKLEFEAQTLKEELISRKTNGN
jgi:hypothetical protein